jgi:hypothetical protein
MEQNMKIYKQDDFNASFKEILRKAQNLWYELADDYIKKGKEPGSCVIGDGFYVHYLPPRCRNPRELKILRTESLVGSLPYESTKDEIHEFLKINGIECFYKWGRLD